MSTKCSAAIELFSTIQPSILICPISVIQFRLDEVYRDRQRGSLICTPVKHNREGGLCWTKRRWLDWRRSSCKLLAQCQGKQQDSLLFRQGTEGTSFSDNIFVGLISLGCEERWNIGYNERRFLVTIILTGVWTLLLLRLNTTDVVIQKERSFCKRNEKECATQRHRNR